MQLLKITTTPIEYKLQIENASLKVAQNTPASITPKTVPSKLSVKSQNIKVRLDTTAARDSLGLHNPTTAARIQGDAGMKAAQEATAQYAAIGNQLAQIQHGADIPSVFAQVMDKQSQTAMVFLPSQGPDISWQPNELKMNYKPAKVQSEWQSAKFSMEYIPSKYKMDIIKYPSVSIEYIGGPNYVPKSSDPNAVKM